MGRSANQPRVAIYGFSQQQRGCEMSIEKIFTNPSFRSSSAEFYPNRLYGDGKKIGAVVVVQGRRGDDYPLGVAGRDYVVKAEAEGRIKEGFVVLAKQNDGRLEYIASARASEVAERLRNVTPWEGKWGPYHWITETFCPVSDAADKPF
jgi:hypothetical protein